MKHAVLRPAIHRKRLLAAGTVLAVLALGLMGLAAPAMASTSCSVTWTGNAGNGLWGTASNPCLPTLGEAPAPLLISGPRAGMETSLR
jgi:hypothetical protein